MQQETNTPPSILSLMNIVSEIWRQYKTLFAAQPDMPIDKKIAVHWSLFDLITDAQQAVEHNYPTFNKTTDLYHQWKLAVRRYREATKRLNGEAADEQQVLKLAERRVEAAITWTSWFWDVACCELRCQHPIYDTVRTTVDSL